MRRHLLLLLSLLLASGIASGQAQYPAHAIKLVVPFPPAGATDIIGRILAQKLGEQLRQPIVVDNKPGAGGAIGTDSVAKATPDGYTILIATSSTHSVGPALQKLPYDPVRDFAAITQIAVVPDVLLVSPTLPVSSVADLIRLAKSKPGQLNFASSGVGTIIHLNGELFKMAAGVDMVHVPYKGAALATPDLASGTVAMLIDSVASALPNIRSGKAKPLAVNADKRTPLLPDVPTLAEAGLPQFNVHTWFGLFAPAGTPPEIVARLNAETVAALRDPGLRERFAAIAAEPVGNSPAQLVERIRTDGARWAEVIRSAKVPAQ